MLEARSIVFAYRGGGDIFHDLSLEVAPTERVALDAPSGTGKTTLCKVLSGYLCPQRGEVLVDGQSLPKRGICPVQLVSQHPELAFDPRLRLKESLAEAGEIASELLEALDADPAWLKRRPAELSGGELQRLCVVRALTARPRYLVADEISTMLDAVTQARVWSVILEWCASERMGLVLVTHSVALRERLATRIVKLSVDDASRPC